MLLTKRSKSLVRLVELRTFLFELWDHGTNMTSLSLVKYRLYCQCITAAANQTTINEMISFFFCLLVLTRLRDSHCKKSPDSSLWKINPGATKLPSLETLGTRDEAKRQRSETQICFFFFNLYSSGFSCKFQGVGGGGLFNAMTSFLPNSVLNGFHTRLLSTGDLGC